MLFLIIIICLLCIITLLLCFSTLPASNDPPTIISELEGPAGPVEIDYEDILTEIDHCTSPQGLKLVHTRILIFQSCYPDAAQLTNAILTAFILKEQAIKAAAKAGS